MDRPNPVLHIGRGGAKRCEIMFADEVGCRSVHCIRIQGVTKWLDVTALKQADNRPPPYPIFVCFRARRPLRVEIAGNFFNSKNADLGWKQRICCAQYRITIHVACGSDVRNLALCMNTGIGAARAGHPDAMIEQFLKRLLQFALNRREVRLDLPAMIAGAVIGNCQLEVPHSIGYSMCVGARHAWNHGDNYYV